MGIQNNLLKLAANQAKRTALRPFYNIIYKFKKLTNIQTFFTKIFKKLSGFLKELLSARPKSYSDYFKVGGLLVFKKLLVIALILICLAPIIFFELINKPAAIPVSQEDSVLVDFIYMDPDVQKYSGAARILSSDKKLVYEGQIDKGVCTGTGKLYDLKGTLVYDGEFKNNEYCGKGMLYAPSGTLLYEGLFDKNNYNGEGTLYNKNATILYSGTFLDNMRSGTGKLFDISGSSLLYEGEFAFDKYDGQGTLYNPLTSRISYKGEFKNGLLSGSGVLYTETGGSLFEGQFLLDGIDYAVFLGALSSELPGHISSESILYSTGVETCLTYKYLPAAFGIETPLEDPEAQPTINYVTVFDNTLPYGLQELKNPEDFKNTLGEPLYSGLTFPSLNDMTALCTLAMNGTIKDTDDIFTALPINMDTYIYDTESYMPEIYLMSYEYSGAVLSVFFSSEKGGVLYYELSKG